MPKLAYLQQWRGLAIILVLLAHTTHHHISGYIGIPFIDNFIWFGGHGVTLFFVLSAFTIFYSLSKTNDTPFDKAGFFIKRFFRIAPLYYLGLIFYRIIVDQNYAINSDLFLNLIFFTWPSPSAVKFGVPGGWSITTEFTFYYLLPFIYLHIRKTKNAIRWLLLGIIISRVLVTIYSHIYPNLEPFYYLLNPLTQFPIFLIGIIIFNLIEKKETLQLKPVDLMLIATILLLEFGLIKFVIRESVVVAIMFAILIYLNASYKINVPFVNKVAGFIGELSFTIYITHFAVVEFLKEHYIDFNDNSIIAFCFRFFGALLLSIIVSLPIHYLIEKPCINFGRKLIDGKNRRNEHFA